LGRPSWLPTTSPNRWVAPPRGSGAYSLSRARAADVPAAAGRIPGQQFAAAIGIRDSIAYLCPDTSANLEGEDEVSEPKLLDPTPELPDDTPIGEVELPARIRKC